MREDNKSITFIPYEKSDRNNKLFNVNNHEDDKQIWSKIKKTLENDSFECNTLDRSKFNSGTYFYYNSYYLSLIPIIRTLIFPNIRLIYLQSEPEGILPVNNYKNLFRLSDYFDLVLTYDDSILSYKIKKTNITFAKTNFHSNKKNKLFIMMLSNKFSRHKNEIYSERRSLVNYLVNNFPLEFDLYGIGWNMYDKSLGFTEDKIATMSKYKFSFVLENMELIEGYISERLFDSYQALTVPIYKGAKNVLEYVPKNTLILLDDFENLDALIDYLVNMPENKYQNYLKHIELFRKSKDYSRFTLNYFVKETTELFSILEVSRKSRLRTFKFLLRFSIVNIQLFNIKVARKLQRLF